LSSPNLDGWLPFRFFQQNGRPKVEWLYAGAERFLEPFFESTLERIVERPFRLLFRQSTPLEVLIERAEAHPGVPPSGFIFHWSHCGSTLITQMLAVSAAHLVISEGTPLESAVIADFRVPGLISDESIRLLRAVVSALTQPRTGGEQRAYIKFNAWPALALPLIRRAYPDVPWIFVYRHPLETMGGLRTLVPAFAMPGMPLGGFNPIAPAEALAMEPDAYAVRLIAEIGKSALRWLDGSGLLLNYNELPGAIGERVAPHFGWTPSGTEIAAMECAAGRNAKFPEQRFQSDNAGKRQTAASLQGAVETWLTPVYCDLEARRLNNIG
jgi:hypothetical protein